jgi:hypothetical protein
LGVRKNRKWEWCENASPDRDIFGQNEETMMDDRYLDLTEQEFMALPKPEQRAVLAALEKEYKRRAKDINVLRWERFILILQGWKIFWRHFNTQLSLRFDIQLYRFKIQLCRFKIQLLRFWFWLMTGRIE